MKLLSESDIAYYRYDLIALLLVCNEGEEYYTHHFHYNTTSSFIGSDTRPFLRKCLRTLESKGYLVQKDMGMNIHKWAITEKAANYISAYDRLNPIKL